MKKNDILNRMNAVFREVLDNETIALSAETTADEIEEWDSLTHISIVVAIEKEFGIRFNLVEIKQLQNIGEFVVLIEQKLS